MKKLYKLYDVIEGVSTIGYYDTLKEVAKACNDYEDETDNECSLVLLKLNNHTTGYDIISKWTYNKTTVTIKNEDKIFMEIIPADIIQKQYKITKKGWEVNDGQFLFMVDDNE